MASETFSCVHYAQQYVYTHMMVYIVDLKNLMYIMCPFACSATYRRLAEWPFEALVDQSWHQAEGRSHNNYKLDAWPAGSGQRMFVL